MSESEYEPSYEKQLQAQAMHTVFTALGGLQVFGFDGSAAVVMDDLAAVRRTQRHIEADGKRYVYTTNVTVSVSRVELR
jgi:hypothetical protein